MKTKRLGTSLVKRSVGSSMYCRRIVVAGFVAAWLGWGLPALGAEPGGRDKAAFARQVKRVLDSYVAGFGSDETQLVYHHRLNGPRGVDALASPAEIAAGVVRGRPLPYGYGSGIQDVALEGGQLLFALCDAHDATGDPELAEKAKWLFQGLKLVATVSPEPGFVPRGPHPDGKSYYKDSSRDQHAALAEGLWRFGQSPLATDDDRRFVARELDEMARRLSRNDWKILVEDGSRVAHVGFTWRQSTSIGAISLLSFLAMTAEATGDPHWRAEYERFSEEQEGHRWSRWLDPDAVANWEPFTLYSNQFAQALAGLKRAERDQARRRQVAELLRRLARRAVESDVFDRVYWRRLDWAGEATEEETRARLQPLGLCLSERATVLDLFRRFDPSWWEAEDARVRSISGKLCFGIPTAAFHKVLLAEDEELIGEVAPHVRRMVEVMLKHGDDYHAGENYNRTVVLGLLLVASEARKAHAKASDRTVGCVLARTQETRAPRVGASTHPTCSEAKANGLDRPDANEADLPYGTELPFAGELRIGPCMDAAVDERLLYVIGSGKLHVADVSEPASPKMIGKLEGLGHVRQICVDRGVAYVTAREDGLFIVDVAQPARPRLLSHYDTIELATGIAVSGDVALIACRTAGVELVDVSDPASPVHLSTVRTGEAQSVDACDGVLYAGVWGSRELVICDVSNPRKPAVIARAGLDGYGDGVDVRGKHCYVATGHHSRAMPRQKPGDPGFGRGHGLEIFDVSEAARPEFVGRVKFPPLYRLGMDMWDVIVTDRYAFVADTYNGLFVVDVSDVSQPRIAARRQLPFIADRNDPSPVGGLAVGDGVIYTAGAWSDLHVVEAPMARPVAPEPDRGAAIPAPASEPPDPRLRAYQPNGQVHAVAFDEDVALVAAGMDGLHAVKISPEIRKLEAYPTGGFAFDVAVCDRRVYVAEGTGGLWICEHLGDGKLAPQGRYRAGRESIRQVVVPPPGSFALLHVGPSTLHVVDVRDPADPVRVLRDSHLGLFYSAPIARGLLEDRYACCHWHVSGLYWYDLAAETPKPTGERYPFRIGSRNGVAFLDGQALATCRGGYALLTRDETRGPDELPIHRVPGSAVHGKPTLEGTMLYVSDRYTGRVAAIDVSDPTKPRLIGRVELAEHPGLVVAHDGVAVIPGGYQGLLVWEGCRSD